MDESKPSVPWTYRAANDSMNRSSKRRRRRPAAHLLLVAILFHSSGHNQDSFLISASRHTSHVASAAMRVVRGIEIK